MKLLSSTLLGALFATMLALVVITASPASAACDYSAADQNDGWGWDAETRDSCAPLSDAPAETTNNGTNRFANCDYGAADRNGGWGWNAETRTSCEPRSADFLRKCDVLDLSCDRPFAPMTTLEYQQYRFERDMRSMIDEFDQALQDMVDYGVYLEEQAAQEAAQNNRDNCVGSHDNAANCNNQSGGCEDSGNCPDPNPGHNVQNPGVCCSTISEPSPSQTPSHNVQNPGVCCSNSSSDNNSSSSSGGSVSTAGGSLQTSSGGTVQTG